MTAGSRRFTQSITVELETDDGDFVDVELPSKFELCPRCDGRGSHVNPSVDGDGLTREDFEQDPDLEESYFSGVYDVACEECKGLRVGEVPDEEECKRCKLFDQLEAHREAEADRASYRRECAHEAKMGY